MQHNCSFYFFNVLQDVDKISTDTIFVIDVAAIPLSPLFSRVPQCSRERVVYAHGHDTVFKVTVEAVSDSMIMVREALEITFVISGQEASFVNPSISTTEVESSGDTTTGRSIPF